MKLGIRSIFTKIVLWFIVMVAVSLVGLMATSLLISARFSGRDTNSPRLSALFLDDARRAFEEGGSAQLAAYLKRLDAYSESQHFLTDGRGIDLVTGEDRSEVRRARRPPVYRVLPSWLVSTGDPIVRVRASDDRRYRLINILPPRPRPGLWESLQYFLWLPLVIGASCYLLAIHLASPLRNLRRVVERFGRGELGIRFHLARQDEIGELARSFNRMADHIATLLSAERRLLQDVSHELARRWPGWGSRSSWRKPATTARQPSGEYARKPIGSINSSTSYSSSPVPRVIRRPAISRRSSSPN